MSDVDWSVLDAYLAGRCTRAERIAVDQWLSESPANRELLNDWRLAVTLADETAERGREAEILASLRRHWGTPAAASGERPNEPLRLVPPTYRRSRWVAVAKIAAVVFAVLGLGLSAGQAWRHSRVGGTALDQPMAVAVSTARGERRVLTLSDGTVVELAPATTLRWSVGYGRRDRVVELEGEAVFTVVHDAERPFAVRTPNAMATDLGTRFAMRAYPGDTATDVVVADGVVAVSPDVATIAPQSNRVVLRRGDRAQVQRAASGEIVVSHGVMLEEFFAWTGGRLVLRGVPLRDAVLRLERWYDIDIRYDTAALGHRLVSASFDHEPSAEAVRVIAAILGLQVSRAGRVYTLRAQ